MDGTRISPDAIHRRPSSGLLVGAALLLLCLKPATGHSQQVKPVAPDVPLPSKDRAILLDGQRLTGRLIRLSQDSVFFAASCIGKPCRRWHRVNRQVALNDLLRLEVKTGDRALRGALIGFGLGAAAGTILGLSGPDPDDVTRGGHLIALFGGFLGGVGGVAGVIIGARTEVWIRIVPPRS